MIIDNIRAIQLDARRNRATTEHAEMIISLSTTLIGEADTVAKNVGAEKISDTDMLALVNKFIKNLDITIEHATGTAKDHAVLEKTFLLQFRPQQLTEDQLVAIVDEQIAGAVANGYKIDMGFLMKHLKENHAGKYDAKLASTVIKAKL